MIEIREAMILAAGVGSRLATRLHGLPKCLVPVAGIPIIVRQIQALRNIGIRRLIVVTGYQREQVETTVLDVAGNIEVVFRENARYHETNVLASWYVGSDALTDDYLYMHADTVYEPEVLRRLQQPDDASEVLLSVDTHSCGEEEMKVIATDDRITEISKTLNPASVLGEFTGVLRASHRSTGILRNIAANTLALSDGNRQFFERVLQSGIDEGTLVVHWVDITGLRWREIDFPEDLDAANRLFSAF